ncbi:hypothetical protein EMIT07CA2_50397 [Brevibacillus sp. IT-7CA2]
MRPNTCNGLTVSNSTDLGNPGGGGSEVKTEHATVYNFMVKDFHTYFVSNLKIWTHNSCVDLNAVATYIKKQGKLPDNYITKDEARALVGRDNSSLGPTK